MAGNRWISDLHWRRQGLQSRSQTTQDAILNAAETLVLERGTERTSIADIALAANVSTGALYHHFKDKKAIFYALFKRMTDTYSEITTLAVEPARWEGAHILDILSGFIEFCLVSAADRPAFRAAALQIASEYRELGDHFAEIQKAMYAGLAELLLTRKDEIGHARPERAVPFVLNQIGAMLRARLDDAQKKAQIEPGTDCEFTENTLACVSAFLRLSSGSSKVIGVQSQSETTPQRVKA